MLGIGGGEMARQNWSFRLKKKKSKHLIDSKSAEFSKAMPACYSSFLSGMAHKPALHMTKANEAWKSHNVIRHRSINSETQL